MSRLMGEGLLSSSPSWEHQTYAPLNVVPGDQGTILITVLCRRSMVEGHPPNVIACPAQGNSVKPVDLLFLKAARVKIGAQKHIWGGICNWHVYSMVLV